MGDGLPFLHTTTTGFDADHIPLVLVSVYLPLLSPLSSPLPLHMVFVPLIHDTVAPDAREHSGTVMRSQTVSSTDPSLLVPLLSLPLSPLTDPHRTIRKMKIPKINVPLDADASDALNTNFRTVRNSSIMAE